MTTEYLSANKRLVDVFRSQRDTEMYLYVDKQQGLSRVPAELQEKFGRAELALSLLLEPSRKLARANAVQVLQAITEQGFYLQLPPLPTQEMAQISLQNSKLER